MVDPTPTAGAKMKAIVAKRRASLNRLFGHLAMIGGRWALERRRRHPTVEDEGRQLAHASRRWRLLRGEGLCLGEVSDGLGIRRTGKGESTRPRPVLFGSI